MIIDNIKHTRSHRRFTEKKINEEEILELPEDYDSKAVIILGEAKDIVKLVDSKDEEDTKYFIENGIHHVPKLKLGDLILAKK